MPRRVSTPGTPLPNLNAVGCVARFYGWLGRLLLVLIAISFVTAPLTQRIWTWDRFLHGGHDFESGVLIILITLSLVLLLAQLCKGIVKLLLAAFCLFAMVSFDCSALSLPRGAGNGWDRDIRGPAPGSYILPLQI